MMRGMAVPTTVWSSAESSMPSMTAAMTKATRRRLSVSPQGWGTGCAGVTVRTSAMPRLRACRRRRGGFLRGRLGGDAEKAAVTADEGAELVVSEGAEPAERVFLAPLAQAGGELLGRRRGGHQRAPAVLRVAFAHGEAELDELVDEEAGGRLAEI